MIYFITKRYEEYKKRFNPAIFKDIEVLDEADGMHLYFSYAVRYRKAFVDVETNGLDPYLNKILLIGIMFKQRHRSITFVFDNTIDADRIVEDLLKHYVIGHNLKFDIKMLAVHASKLVEKLIIDPYKHLIKNVYDTMLAEQRLWMGSGLGWSLADLTERHLKEFMSKDTRDEFVGVNPNLWRADPHHLYYLHGDLKRLPALAQAQKTLIHRFGMQYLIYGIENPLIAVIANAELLGIGLDEDKWIARINDDIEKKHNILLKLDSIVANLRDTLFNVQKDLLTGGKWNKKRIRNPLFDKISSKGVLEIPNLFGETTSAIDYLKKGKSKRITKTIPKIPEYEGCVSYTKQEVMHIFCALNQPAITEHEVFAVPMYINKKLNFDVFTIDAKVLERYLILRPDTIMKEFLETFGELQKVNKSLTTYGKAFLEKINPETGNLHTAFRQCFADTGRFQSGGGKKEPDKPNFQNIPAEKVYRQAFVAPEGYYINTADYSGAELIVMASHAQDFKLIELSKGDMHSTIGTNVWRSIFASRADSYKAAAYANRNNEELFNKYMNLYQEYHTKSIEFTMTKEYPKGGRKAMKPMGFGVIYGMYAAKAGKTLNITTEEGKISINVIKQMVPNTIRFVEQASYQARNTGFVLHNTRTNSRRWFPMIIKKLKGQINPNDYFKDLAEEESAARNSTIQGTQADFVKEASVKLQYTYWKKRLGADLLSWVHDELVCRIPVEKSEEIANLKKEIMVNTANLYLTNVTIDVEMETLPYWTK